MGAADLVADQVRALLHTRLVVGGARGLPLHADDRLLLAVEFFGETRDRGGGQRHRLLETRGLGDQLFE